MAIALIKGEWMNNGKQVKEELVVPTVSVPS